MPERPKIRIAIYAFMVILGLICVFAPSCSKNGVDNDIDNNDTLDATDTIPPGTVVDLSVDYVTTSTITLSWTAPGDDGFSGLSVQYDFRCSTDSITDTNFVQALKIDSIDAVFFGGTHRVFTLRELPSGITYYFAFKVQDDAGYWSGLSNCVSAACLTDRRLDFPDSALEAVVRNHLNRPTEDIWICDVDTITELNGNDAGIADLDGMQFLTGLYMLHLENNAITDVTPLGGLTNLEALYLTTNQITDISPLSGLHNLTQLMVGVGPLADISPIVSLTKLKRVRFDACKVTDFTPLQSLLELEEVNVSVNPIGNISFVAGLSKLKILIAGYMQLTDLSPLAGLTELEELHLGLNSIANIGALSGLTKLTYVNLQSNQITDLAPLVANSGLGSGDQIRLESNPLSEESINTYIPILRTRGVTVTY